MAKPPAVSGRDALRAFLRMGFVEVRCSGSHHIFRRVGGIPFPVPVHGNKALKPGTFRSILKSANVSLEEFLEYL